MPYRCHFLDENEKTIRVESLRSGDEISARREAMGLMLKVGRFSGYELLDHQGRKVDMYKPPKTRSER